MSDTPESAKGTGRKITVQLDHAQAPGVYANLMLVSHRREEFILDFLFLPPQHGQGGQSVASLRSRVVTTPGHAKRILRALQENIARYEAAFGAIEEGTDLSSQLH